MANRLVSLTHFPNDATVHMNYTNPFGESVTVVMDDEDFANTVDLQTALTAVYDRSVSVGNGISYPIDNDKTNAALAEVAASQAKRAQELADLEALPDL